MQPYGDAFRRIRKYFLRVVQGKGLYESSIKSVIFENDFLGVFCGCLQIALPKAGLQCLATDEFSHYGCRRDSRYLVGGEGDDVVQKFQQPCGFTEGWR